MAVMIIEERSARREERLLTFYIRIVNEEVILIGIFKKVLLLEGIELLVIMVNLKQSITEIN